ncbi:lysine transporter LysE [Haloarcula hispanica N601]|uniref:Lysine transporter LysE n=2 Tax=Haloarcula hispanica TaxID=51589 RepID=V5TNN0_HALHI|nr:MULTISPECIES: LysE family translocator [Haloarcula]AEM57934.1 L-lysine exporter [Haloarcula hispanica ATCC 33960]AHB66683.1 lysine transporter LysE [Haloarcula hispanica N601]KZX47531.1 lysine transporter LysE [Haloarcula sp. K1]MUV51262.1 LysE family translocator [Haloarcula sp. CBA1122]
MHHSLGLLQLGALSLVPTALGGVLFGLALAAPPGPMNAVIAEESALRGWRAGFFAGLGAMTADACFLVLAVLGAATVITETPGVRRVMVGAGGLLMLWFAYGAVKEANTTVTEGDSSVTSGDSRGFRKALVLALTNPYQVAFWLTVGVGLLEPGVVDVASYVPAVGTDALTVQTGHPVLLGGFFGGIGLWITGFPAAIVAARTRIERLAPLIAWVSAAVLAGTGVLFLLRAL